MSAEKTTYGHWAVLRPIYPALRTHSVLTSRKYVTGERVLSGNSVEFRPAWPTFHFCYMNCLLLTHCDLDEIRDISRTVWRLY